MKSFKGLKVRKITFEQDFLEKETAFLKLTPTKQLAWNMEIQRKIWGNALRKSSYKKMRVKNNPATQMMFS